MSAPTSSADVAPAAPNAVPIGIAASGAPVSIKFFEFNPVFPPYQPSVASLALALTPALTDTSVDLSSLLPLPKGLALIRSPDGRQLQLQVDPFFASKLYRIFGYVGEIKLSSGEGTSTPAQLQVVTRIPWKFGATKAESGNSWLLVRVQAFMSKSLFAKPAQVVKLGSCVVGFAEPSSGTAKSCQIVGWGVCSIEDWRAASPPPYLLNGACPDRIHF